MNKLAFLMALGLMCLVAVPLVSAQPRGTRDLTSLKTRHYQIKTDLPRDEALAYGRHMDAIFAEYTRRLRGFGVRNATPMVLYLMSDQREYTRLLGGFGIDATNSGGMFFITQEASGLAVFVEGRDRGTVLSTLQHEGFHQFAYLRISDDLPIWVNEGLAEWFGEALIVNRKLRLGLSRRGRVESLKLAADAGMLMSLEDVLLMSGRQWSANLRSGSLRGWLQYDQAWSVVQFLIHADRGKYSGMLLEYLRACQQGYDADRAIERAFKSRDLTHFEKRYREWLANELEPDPISSANEQLDVLGQGITRLWGRDQNPETLEELGDMLERAQLKAERSDHGMRNEFLIDKTWLEPPAPDRRNRKTSLVLEPSEDGMPPIVRVEGLRVRVYLEWSGTPEAPQYRVVLK